MRVVVPRVHDFHYFSLNEILVRWKQYHSDRLKLIRSTDTLDNYVLECLAAEGVHVSENSMALLELGLGSNLVNLCSGQTLKKIEEKHLDYVWLWDDNLFPEWGYWLNLKVMSICNLVYLSADFDPSFSSLMFESDQPVSKFETYFGEILEADQRVKYYRYCEEVVSVRMGIAVNHLMSSDGGLVKETPAFHGVETPVTILGFVNWAVEMGWELPDEFSALCEKVRPSIITDEDVEDILRKCPDPPKTNSRRELQFQYLLRAVAALGLDRNEILVSGERMEKVRIHIKCFELSFNDNAFNNPLFKGARINERGNYDGNGDTAFNTIWREACGLGIIRTFNEKTKSYSKISVSKKADSETWQLNPKLNSWNLLG